MKIFSGLSSSSLFVWKVGEEKAPEIVSRLTGEGYKWLVFESTQHPQYKRLTGAFLPEEEVLVTVGETVVEISDV